MISTAIMRVWIVNWIRRAGTAEFLGIQFLAWVTLPRRSRDFTSIAERVGALFVVPPL